jgi:hypothetical protein
MVVCLRLGFFLPLLYHADNVLLLQKNEG